MTVWIILLCVAALLIFLLLSPLRLTLHYEEAWQISAHFLLFRKQLLPSKEKSKRKQAREEKRSRRKKGAGKDKESYLRKLYRQKGLSGLLEFFRDLIGDTLGTAKRLFSRMSFRQLQIFLRISGEDAAATAITYGVVCGAVYPAVSALCETFDVRNRDLDISADYTDNTSHIRVHAELSLPLFRMLAGGAGLVLSIIKGRVPLRGRQTRVNDEKGGVKQ